MQRNRKNMTTPRSARAGMTLIEVVIGSALLALSFAAVLSVLSFSWRSATLAANRLESMNMARRAIETLRDQTYDASLLSVGAEKRPIPGLAADEGYYSVSEAGGTVKTITVVIEWTESWGAEQSLSLSTSMSKAMHR